MGGEVVVLCGVEAGGSFEDGLLVVRFVIHVLCFHRIIRYQ